MPRKGTTLHALPSLPWKPGHSAETVGATALVDPDPDGEQIMSTERLGVAEDEDEVTELLRAITLIYEDDSPLRIQARLDGDDCYAGVAGSQAPDAQWPLAAPILIVQDVDYSDEAIDAFTLDRDHRSWSECFVLTPDSDQDYAQWLDEEIEAARDRMENAVIKIDAGSLEILATSAAQQGHVLASAPVSITKDVERRCAMRKAPAEGQYCKAYGGPWTSASRAALSDWSRHRSGLLEVISCDTCEGKRTLLMGEVRSHEVEQSQGDDC